MLFPSFDSYQRKSISPGVLSLLCVFTKGDTSLPLERIDVDWHEVFEAVCRNGLVGLAYHYLTKNTLEDFPPAAFQFAIKKTYEIIALKMALMHRNSADFLRLLNSSGLSYRLVKGPLLAHSVYSNPYFRIFNDLDIFVRESDWSVIDQFLIQNGFSREDNDSNPPPHLIAQDVKQETHYLNKDKNFLVEIHYDDILNAGLATRDIGGFWDRSISTEISGIPVPSFDLEDQIIHLCAHLHHHGYSKLIWFSDLYLLLQQRGERVNWHKLVKTVKFEEAQVQVYYSLFIIYKLLDVFIPLDILGEIRPDPFRLFMHEKFWPLEKILSFQPLPNYYFSFYFIPFLKRLLPDFLVMGRRREKINYLLHLILPSQVWLENYYHLSKNNTWNWSYRFIHPLRLLQIFFGEIFNEITGLLSSNKRLKKSQ